MDLTAEQARVVSCLIEKGATTPDNYPLTSNALTAACNQSTSRDPVVEYRERDVDAVMLELRQMGLARTVTGSGHRVGKHRHIVDEALSLDGRELAVLAVLVLRGPQTHNEITTRTERYADGPNGDPDSVDAALDRLAARPEPLVVRLDRRPGEREPRIDQLWANGPESDTDPEPEPEPHDVEDAAPAPVPAPDLESRVVALEAQLALQTQRLDKVLEDLGE